jgi:hypothetical protein
MGKGYATIISMGRGGAVVVVVGLAVLFVNVVATRRLWDSTIFERPQKVAQTILMWLVPGSVIVVWNVLRESRIGGQRDATANGAAFVATEWLVGLSEHRPSYETDGGDHSGGGGGHGSGHEVAGGSGGDSGGADP